MMERTDRHERVLLRLISRHTLLYTEMVTSGALLDGASRRALAHSFEERPLALQIGGSEPHAMAACARLAGEHGFDEVNMNVGCPSDRVQSARVGACLMAEPERVARCVRAMRGATSLPVTVKMRIGVDERDSYRDLAAFVEEVAVGGCETFIVHARKAWLHGVSPAENRTAPPLRYDTVARLKQDFPELAIVLNGGITTLQAARMHLRTFDGVMLGREAYRNPYLLAHADRLIFEDPHPVPTRVEVAERYASYVAQQLAHGARLTHMTRHVLGLFQGLPGARAWRRHLSEHAHRSGADVTVLWEAIRKVSGAAVVPAVWPPVLPSVPGSETGVTDA
ncbi:MAG: tRNA dihydrouridine(20/20a) synthase DusA [Gammaproteobacteria bacterium]|nr:tRNA dihydrouridine(20/20a) synthase DusA [Gammaproteobacteria bacterium]NIR83636.1 tRNA dihydrouridine(20/20a) synthase DusA [Gammaproteobacteria bacterium]NIR91609.1 tRNA dihydrouridine(20/20a) synthase DusA [Gammaproteobacteria bacterium]NIU04798.1 tRNA dihydrouridine(20/20a) synthase DusA [Gammaproteobacteria bacterium]NIV53148.1 tRNA dihydrouridine(20/20a) synthase DusA [Gammaproteobacteria bacterium]